MSQSNQLIPDGNTVFMSARKAIVFFMLVAFVVLTSLPKTIYFFIKSKLIEALHLLHDQKDRKDQLELQKKIDELSSNIEQLKIELEKKESVIATLSLKFIQKNELTSSIKEKLELAINKVDKGDTNELLSIQKMLKNEEGKEDEWENINTYMEEVHSGLIQRLKSKFPKITSIDLKLCIYLRMNLTTKEIARLSNMTVRGIEASRYRLRKKMGIDPDTNLTDFILSV